MTNKLYWIAAIPFTVLTFACNSSNNNSANADSTVGGKLEQAGDNMKDATKMAANEAKQAMTANADSNFVVRAMTNNQNEITMLEAGAKMGTDKDLKSHAKMMLSDHNALEKKLEAYAAAKNYPVMVKDNAGDKLDNMSDKKGMDWDKSWANKMEDGHKDNITIFENARNDVKDGDLKAMIDNTLPTLHKHLDMVMALKEKMK